MTPSLSPLGPDEPLEECDSRPLAIDRDDDEDELLIILAAWYLLEGDVA